MLKVLGMQTHQSHSMTQVDDIDTFQGRHYFYERTERNGRLGEGIN